ncbi:MAG TPA: enoyl-CoA hydratase-related protein [Deltaproteobacteria bacterium]|nr:enoyl-CoA hydratase-related protein [Deltaproteobacteria bacterium]HQI80584.1 enoyl-CoA hydratase-related protein [Deltaproteobacteria bacterium]
MHDETVLLSQVRSHVGTLTINRPERKNALSPELLFMIHSTLDGWARRDDVRCVVITGTGRSFSSGYDIASLPTTMTPELEELMRTANPLEFALSSVAEFPYPVIAMMNGHAFGAGLNLAVCCDIRVASDNIRAGMPPARLGLVYHPEGLRQFMEVAGMARAREIFFTGRTYTGPEALAMGLVDRLVPEAELEAVTYGLAGEIAANAPLALKGMKRIMAMYRERMRLDDDRMKEAIALMNEAFASADIREGQAAFFEKRKPRFTGE